jgi:hypothetical protein
MDCRQTGSNPRTPRHVTTHAKSSYRNLAQHHSVVPLAKPAQLVVRYIHLLDAFTNSAQAVAFRIRQRVAKSLDPNEISKWNMKNLF